MYLGVTGGAHFPRNGDEVAFNPAFTGSANILFRTASNITFGAHLSSGSRFALQAHSVYNSLGSGGTLESNTCEIYLKPTLSLSLQYMHLPPFHTLGVYFGLQGGMYSYEGSGSMHYVSSSGLSSITYEIGEFSGSDVFLGPKLGLLIYVYNNLRFNTEISYEVMLDESRSQFIRAMAGLAFYI